MIYLGGSNLFSRRSGEFFKDFKQVFRDIKIYVGLGFCTFLIVFLFAMAGFSGIQEVFQWADETDDAFGYLIAPVLGAYAGLILIYVGFHEYSEYNLIRNTATTTIRSAPVGRVEVKGTVKPLSEETMLSSPFLYRDCVAYDCEIEEYHHDDDGGDWRTVWQKKRTEPFFIEDNTGLIMVQGQEAEWSIERNFYEQMSESEMPDHVRQFLENNVQQNDFLDVDLFGGEDFRFTSYLIVPGESLYVMGQSKPLSDEDVGVEEDVELQIEKDPATGMFYLSDSSETDILNTKWWKSLAMVLVGIILLPSSVWGLAHVLGLL